VGDSRLARPLADTFGISRNHAEIAANACTERPFCGRKKREKKREREREREREKERGNIAPISCDVLD